MEFLSRDVRLAPSAWNRAGSPARDDDLLAREELDAVGAVDVQVAKERALPAAEREEGKGLRDRHVDPGHACLDALAELPGRAARLREDRGHVAEGHPVRLLDG